MPPFQFFLIRTVGRCALNGCGGGGGGGGGGARASCVQGTGLRCYNSTLQLSVSFFLWVKSKYFQPTFCFNVQLK
jgi:hypothetical protein